MRDRGLLSIKRIDAFKDWLVSQGYKAEPSKGAFEVLRVRKSPDVAPVIYYQRDGAKEHLTSFGDGLNLARKFVREDQVVRGKRRSGGQR